MVRRAAAPSPDAALAAGNLGALALGLMRLAQASGPDGVLHVASSERRAVHLARLVEVLAPDLAVAALPAWDCLPYDRASPSRDVMGRRIAALGRIAGAEEAPRLLVTTADALLQRLPPRATLLDARLHLTVGGAIDPDLFVRELARRGYIHDERVDEPGEIALRGGVIDLYPAAAASPVRLDHAAGRIAALRAYAPASQRTEAEIDRLLLEPCSELITAEPDPRPAGIEHWLPAFYPHLETVLDRLPRAALVLEPRVEERLVVSREQIASAHEGRLRFSRAGEARAPLPPDQLYLTEGEWREALRRRPLIHVADGTAGEPVPRFATERRPARAFGMFLAAALGRSRVVLAGATERDLRLLGRRAEETAGRRPEPAATWAEAAAAPRGSLLKLPLDLEAGFVDDGQGVTVIAAADLLGSRAGLAEAAGPTASPLLDDALRIGDAVVHLDHGLAALSGLEAIGSAGQGEGEVVRLDFAGDAKLLVPVNELDRIWRYGAEAEGLSLDRLGGEGWLKRRAAIEAEIAETAQGLVGAARERAGRTAPKLAPPAVPYERFAARFPYPETPDQARAIAETLDDLASGRPMDRLVCGDVGFGKTEVALRAAAAAALAGKQVAVAAPTTVLVRQHLETFRRRFAGLGVEIGHLSRLVKPAEAKAVKAGLKDGSIRIVVGTHALAGKGVAFQDLGLVVVDEEQRFGTAHKGRLRALGEGAHVLTLTATPIPRTLQAAMVGLQSFSVIATPPSRRRPIRTFVASFDPVTAREALLRERNRGGQSFVVCPRIEDIEPMAARLTGLVPDLEVLAAHGAMSAEAADEAMVRFAGGEGDVLLATNIIESGLDVPRANTMLIWRADRFGLAQLHQLRGRVGRGRAQGIAYLLTDPTGPEIAPATRKRLETLAGLDRLGAGFAVSARDLDLRGAGDLLGDEQAGHMKLIGAGLYRELLGRALRAARGERLDEERRPELNLNLSGLIPADYVPEPELRLDVYARLARLRDPDAVEALRDEIEDRFGSVPEPVADALALARLRALACGAGVSRIDAGPQALALTFRDGREPPEGTGGLRRKGERFILDQATRNARERLQLVLEVIDALER